MCHVYLFKKLLQVVFVIVIFAIRLVKSQGDVLVSEIGVFRLGDDGCRWWWWWLGHSRKDSVAVCANDMREFASPSVAFSGFSKIRTFPDMLFVTVYAFLTITEDCEITTDTVASANMDVWIRALFTGTATVVGEMDTKRGTFGCRVV